MNHVFENVIEFRAYSLQVRGIHSPEETFTARGGEHRRLITQQDRGTSGWVQIGTSFIFNAHTATMHTLHTEMFLWVGSELRCSGDLRRTEGDYPTGLNLSREVRGRVT